MCLKLFLLIIFSQAAEVSYMLIHGLRVPLELSSGSYIVLTITLELKMILQNI